VPTTKQRRARARLARTIAAGVAAVLLAACSGSHRAKQVATTTTAAPTTTTTAAPLAAGQQVSFYVPVVGDCFDLRTVGAAPTTSMIHLLLPCRLPHQSEVYAAIDYPNPAFPGTAALEAFAKQNCVAYFAGYVGRPYETSSLNLGYDVPDQGGWNNGIRHVIGCLVVSGTTDRLAGTVRGSKR
jgi:hypothetical protein